MQPTSTSRKSPTSIIDWIDRVHILLNYVNGVPPTTPWLLIPVEDQEELTQSEAEDLFAALRMRLFNNSHHPSVSAIRHNLQYLTHDERLVLLYGLRYIALRDANHNRYWPLCLELLFNNQISLDDLRMRLAEDLTDQWLTLLEETRGRLFRPQFGKRYIKWPLAHAGLLGRDKALLREFKVHLLHRYQQADWELLLTTELLDDFMTELLGWLRRRVLDTDSFLKLLVSDERGWITAELAQQFVGHIEADVPSEEIGSERNNYARAEFMYVASRNQLEMRVTLQFAEAQGLLYVDWDSGIYPCMPDMSESRYTVRLPLRASVWPDQLTLKASSETLSLRLRKLPTEPVLFNVATGRHVRTWELGGSYYLLLPDSYITPECQQAFQLLFPYARTYGQPLGEWQGYSMHWIQLTSLASRATTNEGHTAVEINRATNRLDLPTLDHAWRPSVSLVGGKLLQAGDPPHYEATQVPLLYLTGVWQAPLQVEYQCWNPHVHRFETLAACEIASNEHVQEHWLRYTNADEVVVARHRVLVDGQVTEWQTRFNSQRFQQQRLAARLEIYHGYEFVQRPNRAALSEYTLVIQAWPYAEVVLHARTASSTLQQIVRFGTEGEVRLPIDETLLTQLPYETLQLSVLWNGLALCEPLECHASSAMMAEDLLVSFRDDQPDMLEIVGQLRDVAPGTSVLIVVIGAVPWRNQIWQKRQRVLSDGVTQLSLSVDRLNARWVLVCTQRGSAAPEGLLLHTLPDPHDSQPLQQLEPDSPAFRIWERCLSLLDTVLLPDELRRLVRLTQVEKFRRHPVLIGRQEAQWTTLATVACCKRVSDWRALGIDVPIAICTWTPSPALFNRAALFLTPTDALLCAEVLRRPGVTLDVDVRYPNGVRLRWLDGTLVSEDDDGAIVVRLRSQDMLSDCSDCRIVMTPQMADGHTHLALRGQRCRRDLAVRRQSPRVRLVAFFDPLDVLRSFRQSLQQLIAGQSMNWPDTFDSWLHKLYECFEESSFTQEDRWLEGLVEAIGVLLHLLSYEQTVGLTTQRQQLVLVYQPALIKLLQAIEEL